MAIYFFDKNQTLIKIVPESATFEAIQTQELDDDSLLKDTLSVTIKGDEKLLNAEYMAVKSYTGNAQAFDMYRIVTDTTPDKSMSFTGMSLAPYELNGHVLQDSRPTNQTISYTLNRVLDGTDWRVGYIEDGLSNVTTTFYYVSAKEALKELQSLVGCEFVFKVEISGQKITDKWIEVYSEMGNRTKKRFNYGTNALTVVRETNKADIFTALIGRGKGEEVSSADDNESGQAGYGRKITFEDIEWSTAKGNPLNKPAGQYFLELPQATQAYGIKNIDGTMKARVGIVDFDDEEDKNRLINLTYQQLLVSSRPKVLFKTTVANIGATGIGDTVTIHRHDLNIHYQTRVRKIVRNKLNDNKTQIELGDAVVTPSTKQAKDNNATIKNLNSEIDKIKANVTTSQNSADGKNTIFYGSAEPEVKRTGDTWYRPHPSIAGETQMLVWNGNAWELVIDTSDLTSVSREVIDAINLAEEAKSLAISEAESALAQAKADATAKANAIKEQISGEVNTAISTAEDAKALAVSEAENALALAKSDATAKANAVKEEVSNSVNTAIETAESAKQTAIDNYNNAVLEAERLVGEQTTAFDTRFGEIEDSVDTVNQSVSDADAKAEAIKQGLGLSDINLTNQQITDQIRSDYNSVKQNANNALTDAGKALTDAFNAQQDADKAIEDFEAFLTGDFVSAENNIATAQSTATDALSKAGTAVSDLDTFKIDYNTFITDQFNPAFTTATDALSLAQQNEGLFYSANLIDEVTGMSNVYTKAEIDGTNGYVTKSAFTQNAESVNSELERVEGVALASGANINLLVRKDEQSGKYLDTGGVIKSTPDYAISAHKINVTPGEKLTFSQIFARNFRYAFYKLDGTFLSFGMSTSQKFTITVPTNASYMLPSYSTSENYPKIERGELKTQWTLAPQDQVNQTTVNYLTSQIEQTAGKISEALTAYTPTNSLDDTVSSYLNNQSTKTAGAIDTKLTSYAKSEDLNGLATEEFATNQATETANGVKNELVKVIGTKVDSDTLDGYVSQATYESGVEGISKSISTVEGKIPNFVGGKNLIPKSNGIKLIDYPNNQAETYSNGFTKFLTSAIVSEVYNNKTYPINPKTTYTASATVRTDGTMTNIGWNFYTSEVGSNIVTAKFKKTGDNSYRIFATVTTRPKDANLRFPDITPIGIANATYYEIGEYQLELGEVATDWGLAISDLQTIASLDGNVKSLFTNTSSETSKEIVRKLSAYTPTNNLDGAVSNYLTNETSATAGAINTKLTNYQTTSGLDASVKTLFDNTNSQTAKYIDNKLSAYIPSDTFDSKTQTYLTNNQYQTAGQVTTTLNSYTKTENLDGTVAGYLNNSNSQTASMINTKLTDYQTTDSLDTSVANLFTNETSATAKKIDSSLTAIKGLIPTSIDNQNMLDGTSDVWLQGDVLNNWNMYAYSGPTAKISALPNSTYIVSADVIKEYNDVGLFIFEYQNSTLIKENYVTGLWRYPTDKVRRSFKIKTGANTNNISVGFRFNAGNIQTKFQYRRVQLEHSEIETDWKPSFKDTVALSDYTIFKNDTTDTAALHAKKLSSITAEGIVTSSSVNQTADGIAQRVAKVDADGNVTYANSEIKLDSIVSTVANGAYISNLIQTSNLLQSTITSFAPNQNILKGTDFANEENTMGDVMEYGRKPVFSKADYFSYGRIATIAISETSGEANLGFGVRLPTKDKWYTLSFYGLANWLGTAGVDFYVSDPYKTIKNYKATRLTEYDLATYRIQVTVKATVANAIIYARPQGNRFNANYNNIVFWGVKLEGGEVATKWGDSVSSSRITQLENNINLKVSSADLISQFNLSAGNALIQVGTNKLNITPTTTFIQDATIKSAMIDTVHVKKISGTSAEFTSMVTDALTANTITSTMLNADEAMFTKLFATSMATDKLVAQGAWITNANIVSLDAGTIKTGTINSALIDAGYIVTNGLSADVVESTHIKSSTGLIDKIFADEALITHLTSKTIFTDNIKAIEIDASKITTGELDSARIDAEYIVTNGLTTDVIESKFIKAEVGLVDKIFSTTAYIEELTNKTVFTEKIQAINISADKITAGTLDAGKVKVVNLDAANITTGNLKSINIVNTISYPEGGRTYKGDMTIAGGQISSYVTAGSGYYKSIFLTDRTIRLSNQNATLNMQAGTITFDGTLTGGGQIWYQDNLARLVAGSYNGFALATYRNGTFANRLSVGGWAGEELAPFVDVHATMNMLYNKIENLNGLFMRTDESKTGAAMYATTDNNLSLGGTWGTVIGHLGSDGKTVYEFLKADKASDRVRFAKNINMQGNTIMNQSDERLKHNIYDLERDDLSILKDIRYKNFTFNNQDKETFGFIAQDLQRIMPSMIVEETDGLLSYDSMEYTHFIGHALQQHVTETTTEIETLKSQIASLQDELALLKGA